METFKDLVLTYIDTEEHEKLIYKDLEYQKALNQVSVINKKILNSIENNRVNQEISLLLSELFDAYMVLSSAYRYIDFKHAFLAGITIGNEVAKHQDTSFIKNLMRE